MKYKLLATLLMATTVIVTACEQQATASEYEQNVAALKAECEQLSGETGREYEVVTGKFSITKSTISVLERGGDSSLFNHEIIFISNKKEVSVLEAFTSREQKYRDYSKNLRARIGENYFENGQNPSEEFGICAIKNDEGKFNGNIKYLRKLGDPD